MDPTTMEHLLSGAVSNIGKVPALKDLSGYPMVNSQHQCPTYKTWSFPLVSHLRFAGGKCGYSLMEPSGDSVSPLVFCHSFSNSCSCASLVLNFWAAPPMIQPEFANWLFYKSFQGYGDPKLSNIDGNFSISGPWNHCNKNNILITIMDIAFREQ